MPVPSGTGYSASPQLKTRTPYGQAAMQYRQPMQSSWLTSTSPSSLVHVAEVGHTFWHGASSQCWHASGTQCRS